MKNIGFVRGHYLWIVVGIIVLMPALITENVNAADGNVNPGSLGISGAITGTLTVSADGSGDYLRIQDAVDNANDGYAIIVMGGPTGVLTGGPTATFTYHENVNVNKKLSIIGQDNGQGQPVIDAGQKGSALSLNASGTLIDGLKIINSSTTYVNEEGILVLSSGNIIRNNIITGSSPGIYLYTSDGNMIDSNTIMNNNGGIDLLYSLYNTISNNVIQNNDQGIYIYNSPNNTIYFNKFNNFNNVVYDNGSSPNLWNSPIQHTYSYNYTTFTSYLGNYWSDYSGSDTNGDGTGEYPYYIGTDRDNYPLVGDIIIGGPDAPPVAEAGPFQFAYAGDVVYFDGSASTDDRGIVLYEWDFESDGVYDTTGVYMSHVYSTAGNYTATLRVTDTMNQTGLDSALIIVSLPPVYSGSISSLYTDKPKYLKGQTVNTQAVVTNNGNKELNAQLRFTLQKPDLSIANIETKPVFVPTNGSVDSLSTYQIPTRGSTQGTWTVKTELIYESRILDTKTVTFLVANKI